MFNLSRYFISLCVACNAFVLLPTAQADVVMQQSSGYSSTQVSDGYQRPHFTSSPNPSYGSEIGAKAVNGFTNLLTAPLEIPKNIISTTNQSNIFYGIFGGLFKGIIHTAGRMAVGINDWITFPLLTKPVTEPLYVWDDFLDRDTTYGSIYRLQDPQETALALMPPPPPPMELPQRPAVVESPPPPAYPDTNQKLDTLFKKEMMK